MKKTKSDIITGEALQDEVETLHQLEQAICSKIDRVSKEMDESRIISAWNVLTSMLPEYRTFKEMGIRPSSARGLMGEIMLKYILEGWAKQRNIQYVYYGNLLLPRAQQEGTTQLDSVFITPNFALVGECKSYYGKLTISKGRVKSNNGNSVTPWKQNYGHIMALKEVLEPIAQMYYHNLVYIFSEGVITNYKPEPEEHLMVNRVALSTLDHLNSNDNFNNRLTSSELRAIAETLEQYIPSVGEEEEHIQFVNSLYRG